MDFQAVMERLRSIRAEISGMDSAERFSDYLGIDVYLGDAKFTGPDKIQVNG